MQSWEEFDYVQHSAWIYIYICIAGEKAIAMFNFERVAKLITPSWSFFFSLNHVPYRTVYHTSIIMVTSLTLGNACPAVTLCQAWQTGSNIHLTKLLMAMWLQHTPAIASISVIQQAE